MRHRIRISGRINKCQILWLSFFFFSGVSELNFLNRICLPTDRNGQRIPVLDWYVLFSYLTSRQGGDSAGAEDTVSLSEGPDPWTSVEFGLCLHYLSSSVDLHGSKPKVT